jgi:ABC-type sugar transport system permease subunit
MVMIDRLRTYKKEEVFFSYICVLPIILLAVTFVIVPLIRVFWLGFTNWDMMADGGKFIGLKNYKYLIGNEKFQKSIINTLFFAGVKIPLDLVLSLFIATLLDKKIRGRSFFRAAFFLPVVIPMVAASIVWLWLYNPMITPLNQLLSFLHMKPSRWLYDPKLSMLCIIFFSIWKGLGYNIVIFLAGLQSIPDTYIEAARIDGASSSKIFFKITLPLLSPITYFVLLMGIIKSFNVFTQISVMTPEGGPLYTTGVSVFYIYEQAFQNYNMGRASAAAVILFFIILTFTLAQKYIGQKKVHYQ